MYQMTETEYKFAELIWEEEPIGSGELQSPGGGFRGEGLRRFPAEDDRSIYPEQEAQRSADRRDRSYDRGL